MNEHEKRIASQLAKLPKAMLRVMVECLEDGVLWMPRGVTSKTASTEDLARALAPWLAQRDFLR
jgi:hypothetical protein